MGKDRAPKKPRKEQSALQKANKEIKMLKRQLSRYKKLISRMDMDNYTNIQEAREAQTRERKELKKDKKQIDESAKWGCYSCGEDFLRLVIYQKVNEPYYFRRCPTCGNRTKGKKFDDSIEGIRPEDECDGYE